MLCADSPSSEDKTVAWSWSSVVGYLSRVFDSLVDVGAQLNILIKRRPRRVTEGKTSIESSVLEPTTLKIKKVYSYQQDVDIIQLHAK